MITNTKDRFPSELDSLCDKVRELVSKNDYEACIIAIQKAMGDYPHAPHPHNLMGIVLEKLGDHLTAMKHFRAAWALDPTYLPAGHNLEIYGTFFSNGSCAFDESDLPPPPVRRVETTYDDGRARIVSVNEIKYDKHGIIQVVRKGRDDTV